MKKKVLIFGKDGQLGYDLTRVFARSYNLRALNREELDITDSGALNEVIKKQKPDFIINASAYNKVEAAETEKAEKALAFAVNKEAVGIMAKAAKEIGAIFVHVSSDYVFAGDKDFFTESDMPYPLNAYAESKVAGEELLRATGGNYYLLRTSSVFGAKEGKQKKNFVDTMIAKAQEGQSVKVVDDQIMSPTYSYDLAVKIKELIEKPAPFGIYHITNQGSCSWFEFTKKILELMDLKAEVLPIKLKDSGSKVNRPRRSVLKNLALEKVGLTPMPPWEGALSRYLKEKYA